MSDTRPSSDHSAGDRRPTGSGTVGRGPGRDPVDGEPRRSSAVTKLLAALVGLMALACIFLAMLLVSPARQQPGAAPTVTVTAAPSGGQGSGQPGTDGQQGRPGQEGVGQDTFNAKGYGKLGDRARRQDGDPTAVGKVDAPVVLVEWADYACPFCAVWARDQQKKLVDKYVADGTLRIEWRDLVIFGDKSQRAAQAARAAGLQGRYWQFHEALFAASPTSGHPDLDDKKLEGFAKRAGVPDMARWAKDKDSPAVADAVRKDTAEATGFGANSTPVFAVNGAPLVGARGFDEFVRYVEAAKQARARHSG